MAASAPSVNLTRRLLLCALLVHVALLVLAPVVNAQSVVIRTGQCEEIVGGVHSELEEQTEDEVTGTGLYVGSVFQCICDPKKLEERLRAIGVKPGREDIFGSFETASEVLVDAKCCT